MMIEVERAEGVYMYAPDGKRYIDLISGVSVSNVGHGNPKVVEAVCAQAREYLHLMVYGEYVQSPQVRYAERLAMLLPESLRSVYFVNSGSEAVEGALKLAKRYTGRTELISFRRAYHGSSQGALSMMGEEDFKNAFRPLLPDVQHLEFNNTDELSRITTRTAGVIIEPVQGEGGIRQVSPEFLSALRRRCDEVGALLIFDEIQTGLGRTGNLYAFQSVGVTPDVICTAKAFGGGMPLGAFISSGKIMSVLQTNPPLGHITTFGGHPVCCAAGLAALEYIIEEGLMDQVHEKTHRFRSLLSPHPLVKEIRDAGLIMALDFGDATVAQRFVLEGMEQGIVSEWFLFCDTAVRIAPPLTITDKEIDEACDIILRVMDAISRN